MSIKRKPETVAKLEKAFKLRDAGYSYELIAKQLGCNKRTLHNLMQSELRNRIDVAIEEYRTAELDRLDAMHREIWGNVQRGDLWAVDRMLHIMDQRAKLLGLYATAKTETQATVLIREYGGINPDDV